ncbi:MAG: glycosyltransferase family 39 protein [Gemmatimonadota bacterium]
MTWAVAAAYTLSRLDLGWFPTDAGTLGHAAERVLRGELPHRDYADVYTGGLAFFDALAFRLLGVGIMSMRWGAFAVFLAWVPAFWYVALRLSGPWIAALTTLLASMWTLPVYAEGMPSWFNLWLATFGVAALVRYGERPRPAWLVLAGVAGGLSVLVKVVGLYYLGAGLLYLLLVESRAREGPSDGAPSRDRGYRMTVAVGLSLSSLVLVWLVVRGMGLRHLFLYGAAPIAGVLAYTPLVWSPSGRSAALRFRTLLALVGPYALGALAPIAAFSVPYALTGSLGDLAAGVFSLPARRLDAVRMIGPAGAWYYMILAAGVVALLVRPPDPRTRIGKIVGVIALGALLTLVMASAGDRVYVLGFRTLLWLPPLVGVAAAAVVVRRGPRRVPLLTLASSVFGLTSLVQVPFAAPVYFFYSAPLLLLVALGSLGSRTGPGRGWLPVTLVAFLAFTVLRLNTGFSLDLGFRYRPDLNSEQLVLQRAMGVRVSAEDKRDYEGVVELVGRLDPGPTIYAGPDCPEIYFLTGRANPTPTFYELLDVGEGTGQALLLSTLDRERVRAIVVRPDPLFSAPLDTDLLAELERRYPAARQVGRFLVAWAP